MRVAAVTFSSNSLWTHCRHSYIRLDTSNEMDMVTRDLYRLKMMTMTLVTRCERHIYANTIIPVVAREKKRNVQTSDTFVMPSQRERSSSIQFRAPTRKPLWEMKPCNLSSFAVSPSLSFYIYLSIFRKRKFVHWWTSVTKCKVRRIGKERKSI